jgi:hypothetical protein
LVGDNAPWSELQRRMMVGKLLDECVLRDFLSLEPGGWLNINN